MSAARTRVAIIAILVFYVLVSLYQPHLPGIYYDEVILVNPAFDVLRGQFPVFGNVPYVGALKAYLHAPAVALFGGSVVALRAVPVFVTALTAALLYLLVVDLLGRRSLGLLALVLFVSHPAILFSARMDDGPVSTVMLLEVLTILLVVRALARKNRRWLLLAGAVAAIGCWQKTYFVWALVAIGVTLVFQARRSPLPLRDFIAPACIAVCGCIPLAIFLITHQTLAVGADTTIGTSGVARKMIVLARMLNGQESIRTTTGMWLTVPVLLPVSLAAAMLRAVRAPDDQAGRILRITCVAAVVITVQVLMVAASGRAVRHYALLLPLLPLMVTASIAAARGMTRSVLTALAVISIATQVIAVGAYHHTFSRTGGWKVWSDAIYDLASYVRANPGVRFVALDWGISEPIRFLTGMTARIDEPAWVYPDKLQPEKGALVHTFEEEDTLFILHGTQSLVFPRARDLLMEYANATNQVLTVERQFNDRTGREVFVLYRLPSAAGRLN